MKSQMIEWNEERIRLVLLKYPIHFATHRYVKDLNAPSQEAFRTVQLTLRPVRI